MPTLIHPQLPLGFEPGELFTFDSFVTGNNSIVVGLVKQLISKQGESQIYLWGETGMGKSHILQACCNLAAKQSQTVCYLTSNEIKLQAADIFDDLEQLELICLDDLDQWLISAQWETALFGLINRVREQGGRLLMASSQPPNESFVDMPDLRSRLGWGPVFQLQGLSDAEKQHALQYRAKQNGLELPAKVADYLLQRYPRDMFDLFERLALLDKAAMAAKRKLTIPLVKTVFGE